MREKIANIRIILYLLLIIAGTNVMKAQTEKEIEEERKIARESVELANDASRVVDDVENFGKAMLDSIEDSKIFIKAEGPSPGTPIAPYVASRDERWWWTLLKEHRLNLKDTTVVYPKFIKFCVDVYNWGDRFFNTYNPEYVQSTGKRWKFRLVSDNWLDSYAMRLPNKVNTLMSSDVYANIGAYLQYMAVSAGYSYDVGKLFSGKEPAHRKYEFGFICALFNAELYYHENRGGTNIKKFGDFKVKPHQKVPFPGVEMNTLGFDVYYFFNNKKYSQGAAYNFAKYQLKSQGSFMAGFSYTRQKLRFDFSQLPADLKEYLPDADITNYYFHYNSYAILAGYGYNWVIAPKLLFNITAMPSVGFSHYAADSLQGDKYLISLNIQGRVSLTYNLGNFFFGIFGKMNGYWYRQGQMYLFNSIENFSAYAGIRF